MLREQLGGRRLRINDNQRRRLAPKAKGLGRKILSEVATIVTPGTLLAWPDDSCTLPQMAGKLAINSAPGKPPSRFLG